jgi:small subunit ribosomal protein S19
MTRSIYKSPFVPNDIYRKVYKKSAESLKDSIISTRSRNATITDIMIGFTYNIYNGKNYETVDIKDQSMVGHKLGEFCFTKRMGNFLHKKGAAERDAKKRKKLLAQKKKKSSAKTKSKGKKNKL